MAAKVAVYAGAYEELGEIDALRTKGAHRAGSAALEQRRATTFQAGTRFCSSGIDPIRRNNEHIKRGAQRAPHRGAAEGGLRRPARADPELLAADELPHGGGDPAAGPDPRGARREVQPPLLHDRGAPKNKYTYTTQHATTYTNTCNTHITTISNM